jgi:hypothetical protein
MLLVDHIHVPLFRVIRANWKDALDTSFSRASGGRWNAANTHAVLYVSCSMAVARAVALDVFRIGALRLEDLAPEMRPALAEIDWAGRVVDMASATGIAAAGFRASYPDRYTHSRTQSASSIWFQAGVEGVVCRSASVARLGSGTWTGPHETWGETAIFTDNAALTPTLRRLRRGQAWLR